MNKLIITVGMSGSGKTSWVKSQEGFKVICRDDIRDELFVERKVGEYKPTKNKERLVSERALALWEEYSSNGEDVIIGDTNLSSKSRELWSTLAEKAGYSVEFKEFPITWEEVLNRNLHRGISAVSVKVLYRQWKLWLEYDRSVNKYIPDETKPKAIIIDIDGTVSLKCDRSPFDWSKVSGDKPRTFIISLIRCYLSENKEVTPIFLSGRDEICREDTLNWLNDHFELGNCLHLFMRPQGDTRKDSIVKNELFSENISQRYNVIGVFDDRPQVVEMWYDLGIENVISVADQRNRF